MTEKPRKRRHGDRRDGIWLRDLDPMHGFTPVSYTHLDVYTRQSEDRALSNSAAPAMAPPAGFSHADFA